MSNGTEFRLPPELEQEMRKFEAEKAAKMESIHAVFVKIDELPLMNFNSDLKKMERVRPGQFHGVEHIARPSDLLDKDYGSQVDFLFDVETPDFGRVMDLMTMYAVGEVLHQMARG
ncbi:MAG TPA: hypothetical protein VKC53_00825 [Patescibacteria group bacterium]|nr:hypothetical protein [Patescibacteria group bacterium]